VVRSGLIAAKAGAGRYSPVRRARTYRGGCTDNVVDRGKPFARLWPANPKPLSADAGRPRTSASACTALREDFDMSDARDVPGIDEHWSRLVIP
jgi:hypothetical protein